MQSTNQQGKRMSKQLTWQAADALAQRAADRAMGFGPRGAVAVTITADEVQAVAARAAMIALRLASCLAADDARDRRRNAELADRAEAEQRAWQRRQIA
jgi:hypothetical protein